MAELETKSYTLLLIAIYLKSMNNMSDLPNVKCDRDVIYVQESEGKAVTIYKSVAASISNEINLPTRYTHYSSYLSQVYSKPVDLQITSVNQMERKKIDTTPISISDSSSDNEVYMWVEEPAVINLDSSDENGNSNEPKAEFHSDFMASNRPKDDSDVKKRFNVSSAKDSAHNSGTFQPAKRCSLKRSYRSFGNVMEDIQKTTASKCSGINREVRCQRKKKRKSLGSDGISKPGDDGETFENAGHREVLPLFDEETKRSRHQRHLGIVEECVASEATENEPDDPEVEVNEQENHNFINEFDLRFRTAITLGVDQSTHQQIDKKRTKCSKNVVESRTVDRSAELEISLHDGYAKIFLSQKKTRGLIASVSGYQLLNDASTTHQLKIQMEWERLDIVIVLVGEAANQERFHRDLIACLEDISRPIGKTLPKKPALIITTIRKQLALLKQSLGDVNELFADMTRNEKLSTKKGTKKADLARTNLNIILMGQAGLRDGKMHLAGLERNLQILLEHEDDDKSWITSNMQNEIYQHYNYIFSSYKHDNYPALISEYEQLQGANNFQPLNSDARSFRFEKFQK